MSMPKYTLNDFIATVPSCLQTTNFGVVVEIFQQGQCDRLVVIDEQQCPIGVLKLRRLMPQLINLSGCEGSLDVQQPLWALSSSLLEPLLTIPAGLSVEQVGFYLRSGQFQTNTDTDWALVDPIGRFLGLVDTPRLLQFLATSAPTAQSSNQQLKLDSVVQLLEKLPLPLMLQAGSGEVVMQNLAWWQHFGTLSDPDVVRREVEAILAKSVNFDCFEQQSSVVREVDAPPSVSNIHYQPAEEDDAASSSRCHLGTDLGTCICVLSLPNGQERVWQFTKIPLDSPQLKELSTQLRQVKSRELNDSLWLLLATELTKQQQLASELTAKNADLIQLNRLKDEFLACISHELKTPLTAVVGLSTLLKDQALGQLNERQARYAGLIHQSGRHLMTVVNDILDLTRMETGQMELTPEPVQIAAVCDRALQQVRDIQFKLSQPVTTGEPLAEHSGNHRFTLSIEPGLDSLVADELRLRQILVHLLSNAFKFTEAGGEVGLRVSRWESWIAFTVWDTGIGIPEHDQHLIFQKFQQLENPLTRRFEGTGLGLVLTRALTRLHGGDVSFLSKEGKGSQFTVLLPPTPPYKRAGEQREVRAEVSSNRNFVREGSQPRAGVSPVERTGVSKGAKEQSTLISNSRNNSNRLVLIVEAAPRFIEELTEQLISLGYRVVIARSGTEALEKARRLQPLAVFLNPLLPLLSGWDVLTLLKSDAATCQIPVIVTATRAEKEQALSNRADEFLSLPVQPPILQKILNRFCAIIQTPQSGKSVSPRDHSDTSLTILRLLASHASPLSSLTDRILEADDLEQAQLLARIWQPNVVLLDGVISDPLSYLKQLSQYPDLAALPLVTLDMAIAQIANQLTELSIFPCLTPDSETLDTDALLAVLQIAAGVKWKPNLLVVDIVTLPDLQQVKGEGKSKSSLFSGVETPGYPHSSLPLGSEWLQALIQYLHTSGFRATIGHSWAEVLQQIRQQSVDLLLVYLGNSTLHHGVLEAFKALGQQHDVPPILVLDQRLSQGEVKESTGELSEVQTKYKLLPQPDAVDLDTVLEAMFKGNPLRVSTTKVLSPSISMEELLAQIHQSLAFKL